MRENILAKQGQNVYALGVGGIAAFFSMAQQTVEQELPQEVKREADLKKKEGLAQQNEAEEVVRRVNEKEAEKKNAPKPREHGSSRRVEVVVDAKYFPPNVSLPKDPAVAEVIHDFYQEAGDVALKELQKTMLMEYYVRLRRLAVEKNMQQAFLSKFEQALTDKGVSVSVLVATDEWDRYNQEQRRLGHTAGSNECNTQRIMAARGMGPSVGGGAEGVAADPGWAAELVQEMGGLNAVLDILPDEDYRGQIEELTNASRAVGRLAVPVPEKTEAMRRIKARLDALRPLAQQQAAQEQARRERRRGEEEEADNPLQANDLQGREALDIGNYTDLRIRPKVEEIRQAIQAGSANNQYLKNTIGELVDLRRAEDQLRAQADGAEDAVFETEAVRLFDEITKLKDLLAARSRDSRATTVSYWSNYGEIRLFPKEKRELVELALTARNPNLTPEERAIAQRDIEKLFNQLFSRADARANDDWRDALGNAGSIEVEDFRNALTAAATGRLTYNDRLLTSDEQDRINAVVNQLSQEAHLREYLHSITYYVNQAANAEQIKKVAAGFKVYDADRAFRITGVTEAIHQYEQAMLQTMAKNGGYLPYEAMVNRLAGEYGVVESIVKANMETANKMGMFGRTLEKWEIDRAISLARGMGIVTGRWFEIVAASGIPKERPLVSWWANKIVNKIAFFRQIVRYDVGRLQNSILKYKLEGGSFAWSTKELEQIANLSVAEILDRFVNDPASDAKGKPRDDILADKINPGRIGSVYTQTGWRWGEDKVNHAGAVAHILDGDRGSTIIGVGLWIEKERGFLGSKKELSARDQQEWSNIYGRLIRTEGERAEANIRRNLELAAGIVPLKLFYNLNGVRQQVLRSAAIRELYGELAVREDPDARGQIIIRSKILEEDLSTLALLQEKLLQKRAAAYRTYLNTRYDNMTDRNVVNPDVLAPDLLSAEFTQFDFSGVDPNQADRVRQLATTIKSEFLENGHYERLMRNLQEKGWKIPFVFGTDDIPHDLYSYAGTGDEAFERRWGDIDSVAKGASAYENLIRNMATFRDQENILKALKEIYAGVVGHDENVAREVMRDLIEGIIKFYKKDITARLPFGMGWLKSAVSGEGSYAQIAFGREQMAWDEIDIDDFLKKALGFALISKEQEEELRKKTGAQAWTLGLALARTGTSLFILSFIYFMLKQTSGDLVKKAA